MDCIPLTTSCEPADVIPLHKSDLLMLSLPVCRQNDKLSVYGTTSNARALMLQARVYTFSG
jgi:hypothetical protein